MSDTALLAYCVVGFFLSIFTGIAGGGGGFIMTPFAIFLGLSPAQAVTSGKFNGLAATLGGLSGMRGDVRKVNRQYLLLCCSIALVAGIGAPFIIKSLDQDVYKKLLGTLILLLIPVIWKKKVGIKTHHTNKPRILIGSIATGTSFVLLGTFSGGMGTLVNVSLMHFFQLPAAEAIILKRWSQILLNVAIILGLLGSGLILWKVAAASILFTSTGSYIGGRIAIKKGNIFIMRVTLLIMVISGLYLLLG